MPFAQLYGRDRCKTKLLTLSLMLGIRISVQILLRQFKILKPRILAAKQVPKHRMTRGDGFVKSSDSRTG